MIVEKEKTNMKKENGIALLPIGVFLVLYLGLGILFEYVLKIPMGFYNVPSVSGGDFGGVCTESESEF